MLLAVGGPLEVGGTDAKGLTGSLTRSVAIGVTALLEGTVNPRPATTRLKRSFAPEAPSHATRTRRQTAAGRPRRARRRAFAGNYGPHRSRRCFRAGIS